MLRVKHEADVKHMRLLGGELFIRSYRVENRLRGAQRLIYRVEIHTLVIEIAALDLIGIAHYHGHLREQLNRLAKDVLDRDVIRVLVI